MKRTRRIGTEDSATRTALLDATEKLMLDKGYAAVSTRQVAQQINLTPALVHYYFPTTDDLLVAVFRRASEKTFERFRKMVATEQPLRALWRLNTDVTCTALAMEFMAMANHRKAIRAEIASSAEVFRRMQAEELSRSPLGTDDKKCTSLGITVLLAGVSRLLVLEDSLGITRGHREGRDMIEHLLRWLETAPQKGSPIPRARPSPSRALGRKSASTKPRRVSRGAS